VNWNLPLRFAEHEVEQLQVPNLEPYVVVEGFEKLMIQEECPYSKQELRIILFKERGFDVYFQGYHFHSFNSTSWEVSYIQIHAS